MLLNGVYADLCATDLNTTPWPTQHLPNEHR